LNKEFQQVAWDDVLRGDLHALLQVAIAEDLGRAGDWTTAALVSEQAGGVAAVVTRQSGVIAGLPAAAAAIAQIDARLRWTPIASDGAVIQPGDCVARIEGPARGILSAERLVLNLLGRLSGIATLTRRFVEAVAGTKARIYDTRKTTPGWRRLEKYAVHCGGGRNHRTGLFDAVLIKDNHLALGAGSIGQMAQARFTPAEAVEQARQWISRHVPDFCRAQAIVEIEVDTLEQLDAVLPAEPDIVLLDNMSPAQLREAVARCNAARAKVELEASGGVSLQTVRAIAESGVERISVGALTHSAVALDLGLDWL
jgi:nicotinate-nucleotide pyrophosphorylase (carboxylating)